ncbi:hypothetical protein LJC31_04410 [Synergistaceae bacterium OttesenSCG-928-I11]|nr:hypothetical protein [Synergistaceae bacterium OttesenSCG-928-I11]
MKPAETAGSGVGRTRPCILYRDTALNGISSCPLRLIDTMGRADAELDEIQLFENFE